MELFGHKSESERVKMDNREALEQKLNELEAQKVTLFDSGSADQVEVGRLNEQIKAIRQQLSEIENQQTVETTANEIASSMETYNIGDSSFTIDQLAADEDAAKILRKGIAEKSQKQAQKWLEDINTQKEFYEQRITALLDQLTERDSTVDALQEANAQLVLERDDLEEKRKAAALVISEDKAEIARLNSHVDDLRKEIANGTTPNNIIDITTDADLEAAAQRLKAKKEQEAADKRAEAEAAKIPVYDVKDEFRSQLGTFTTFKFAETGEYGEIIWTSFNAKYRTLDEKEVQRFREELEATKQAEAALVPATDESVELVDFRNELNPPELQNVDTGHILDEHSATGQDGQDGTGGVASVEERLTALELAVFGQVKAAA
jgi:hypothetical protein